MLDHSFPAYTFFFFFWGGSGDFFTPIPLFIPESVHSGSASRDDCARVFSDKLRASSFPDSFTRDVQR